MGAAKTFQGKSLRKGGGGQFAKMVNAIQKTGQNKSSAQAIAATAGRKKYGKAAFQKMAAAGRRRAAAKKKQ